MQRAKLILVFGGLLLFILGFDVLMIVHYVTHLSGPALIAIMSIAAGTFLAIVAAWFGCKNDSPFALKISAFVSKIVLICVGGLSAASIITLYFHEGAEQKTTQAANISQAQQSQTDLAKAEEARKTRLAFEESRSKQIREINESAANMRKNGISQETINELVKKSMDGLPPAPTPETAATPNLVATAQAVNAAQVNQSSGFKAWLLEFADSGIYYVPTIANLLVFIVLSGVMLFVVFGSGSEAKPRVKPIGYAQPEAGIGFAAAEDKQGK